MKDRAAQLEEIDPPKVMIIAEVEDTEEEALIKVCASLTLVDLRIRSTQYWMSCLGVSGRDGAERWLVDKIYSPGAGVQYTSLKRIAIPRSAASVLVARCQAAGISPRSAAATNGPPLEFAELVWVPRRF
jgi:hypothetical protein